jgi:hypothetical protein
MGSIATEDTESVNHFLITHYLSLLSVAFLIISNLLPPICCPYPGDSIIHELQ